MRRKTFDSLLTVIGFGLTAVLLVAGVLLMWGYSYANNTVHSQLSSQQIYFPASGSSALSSPEIGPYLNQYAGQQLLTGAQAQAYADHFIAVHLQEIGKGQTYSELSAKAMQDPTNKTLAGQVQTVFQGTTLRGMLLNAYGWWKMGQIALIAAIASFVLAGLMLILSAFGLWHARKVDPAVQL